MHASIILSMVILCFVALIGCSKKESTSSAKQSANDDSTGATIDDSARPQTIAITTGDLNGASLQVPAGSLPQGTRIALQAAARPDEFASAIESEDSAASGVIAVSIVAADGAPVEALASNAIALSIPVKADDMAYALAPASRVLSNLVGLHQAPDQSLHYWRYPAFAGYDRATKRATLKITRGGLYQLAFLAPDAAIPGFESATEQLAPVALDLGTLQCPDGMASFYAAAKDNATFKSYYDLFLDCTCRRGSLTVAQCRDSMAAAFASSMCVLATEIDQIDDARVEQIYAPALSSLEGFCASTPL